MNDTPAKLRAGTIEKENHLPKPPFLGVPAVDFPGGTSQDSSEIYNKTS